MKKYIKTLTTIICSFIFYMTALAQSGTTDILVFNEIGAPIWGYGLRTITFYNDNIVEVSDVALRTTIIGRWNVDNKEIVCEYFSEYSDLVHTVRGELYSNFASSDDTGWLDDVSRFKVKKKNLKASSTKKNPKLNYNKFELTYPCAENDKCKELIIKQFFGQD